jgi:hypothetical protein
MRLLAATTIAVALLSGAFFLRSQQRAQAAARGATVLVMLGEKAASAERWDGTAEVTGGLLSGIEGWHLSEGDGVAGSAWKCVTRSDAVAPYADVHYTEMRPGARPPVLFHAVGLYLTVTGEPHLAIRTAQGDFAFALAEIGAEPKPFLDGRASVRRVPAAEKLSTPQYEDDEPAIAALDGGVVAVAWVAYRDRADRVLLRMFENGAWSPPEEVTEKPADIFRCALTRDTEGGLWVLWSQREGDRWQIHARRRQSGRWQAEQPLTGEGSNTFVRAAGNYVVWQSVRGRTSDIYLREWRQGAWSAEVRVSESPANDWEPAVAVAGDGTAWVAWDSYDRGNYDVFARSCRGGVLSLVRAVTTSPKFQAHAAVAVDAQNRPWFAWDESGVNWGKDQGFLIPTPLATPLHQQRTVRVALWDGSAFRETRAPPPLAPNAEHPQIAFDGRGSLAMIFRHWTRRQDRAIGSPMAWENYLTRLDVAAWQTPAPLPHSAGSVEKNPALARDSGGELWAAWMTDERPFATAVPQNADIYCARLGAPVARAYAADAFAPLSEPFLEAIPVHNTEPADVAAVRRYTVGRYRIYRGDMHRHTDVSQDFKYDGSLLEVYRYALDAAGFDYVVTADHQAGYDQEFTWWQNQKLVDLFYVPGVFTPLYGYERSVPFPNGHRNVVFDHRGVRTLPIPPDERDGLTGAGQLYRYLRENRGISMPHSSATSQGTDWRDNDPEVEPLVEIYQGYRTSYEYEGAPRAATALNQQAQKSGWQPEGFVWNAWAKGYRLGVQASSDHWSTHISYACILADRFTREGLLEAIRKRHAYAATDNIVLDFRARSGTTDYVMGDAFTASAAPRLLVSAAGTGTIKQIDVIRDRKFVYTARPAARQTHFEYTDGDVAAGQSWYYVRVIQEDGQMAWSSPIWITRK